MIVNYNYRIENFNRNRHYQNGGGHGGGGGGGGQGRHGVHNNGIQKWPRGGKHTGNRHIYINRKQNTFFNLLFHFHSSISL